MSNNQPIQFLLHQLATNEQDRERFNLLNPDLHATPTSFTSDECFYDPETNWLGRIEMKEILGNYELAKEKIIRTCLSRVNGQAVLGVFEGEHLDNILNVYEYEEGGNFYPEEATELFLKSDFLYLAFDRILRHGKTLDEALQSLHEKMLELVPEYVEFLNSNK
jgi:hypothetical protein